MTNPLKLIVMGASAGGIPALKRVLGDLPADLRAAVAIVLHTHPSSPGFMAGILDRYTGLQVRYGAEGDALKAGHAYLAPADHHLVVRETGLLGLESGPKVLFHRPAANPLFESAACVFGRQVVGVVLSGGDVTAGLKMIKKYGGSTMVQSSSSAAEPSMPRNANLGDTPDQVVPVECLEGMLRAFVGVR